MGLKATKKNKTVKADKVVKTKKKGVAAVVKAPATGKAKQKKHPAAAKKKPLKEEEEVEDEDEEPEEEDSEEDEEAPRPKKKKASATSETSKANGVKRKRAAEDGEEGEDDDEEGEEPEGKVETASNDTSDTSHPIISFKQISSDTADILGSRGITHLFPIQAATFKHIFAGKDVLARARTGTGKTLAFVLPIVEKLRAQGALKEGRKAVRGRAPMVLVLTPTRELAGQVFRDFEMICAHHLKVTSIYGGAPFEPQERDLRTGVDVVVGTPGRVIDHAERGNLLLQSLKWLVLDEADQMLDIGFKDDIEKVLGMVRDQCGTGEDEASDDGKGKRQPLQMALFSATVPKWVHTICNEYFRKGDKRVTVDLVEKEKVKTASSILHLAITCPRQMREEVVGDVVNCYSQGGRAIVFANTKAEANTLAMTASLKSEAQVLHGDIPQKQREMALKSFRDGGHKVLVATDVAARGLDIPDVELVIQCQPPKTVETYIHRSGRTGRAGKSGTCVTFATRTDVMWMKKMAIRTGIQLRFQGAPQKTEIVRTAVAAAESQIKEVDSSVVPLFLAHAERLIQRIGSPGEALATALAVITGHTKPLKTRSLMSAFDGFTTMQISMTTPKHVDHAGFFWRGLRNILPESLIAGIRGMTLLMSRDGACFDVPSEQLERFQDYRTGRGLELSVPEQLPDLLTRDEAAAAAKGGSKGFGKGGRGGGDGGKGAGRGGKGKGRGSGGQEDDFNKGRFDHSRKETKVFVGGMPFDITASDVHAHFAEIGEPMAVKILTDAETGNSKGVGFVQFKTADEADRATAMDGSKLGSRRLRVNMANS